MRRQWPTLRVLVYSSAASPVLVSQVAAAGAYGFLNKSAEAVALLAAIRAVHTGQLVFPARLRLPVLPSAAPTGSPLRHSGRRCAAAPAAAFGSFRPASAKSWA